jgi:hypothetical protein
MLSATATRKHMLTPSTDVCVKSCSGSGDCPVNDRDCPVHSWIAPVMMPKVASVTMSARVGRLEGIDTSVSGSGSMFLHGAAVWLECGRSWAAVWWTSTGWPFTVVADGSVRLTE